MLGTLGAHARSGAAGREFGVNESTASPGRLESIQPRNVKTRGVDGFLFFIFLDRSCISNKEALDGNTEQVRLCFDQLTTRWDQQL